MANRYGRDIGRRDRESTGGEGYGRRSSGSGSRPFGDDERYFGGSRRYGEGYTGQSYRDFDTTDDRDYSSYGAGYGSDYTERGSREDYGRYRQGNERTQGGESGRRYGEYSGRRGGYGNYGGPRFEDRWGGQGGEDVGRYRSGYGPSYPSSERGYMRDYDEDDRGWWDKTSDEVASWFGDDEAAQRRKMDAWRGGHRGRGPTGYTRSDERIKEDINDRLTDYDYIDATSITADVSSGEVTLSGTVNSRYEKRLAEDIAEDVSGVRNVENRIRVSDAWRSTPTKAATTTTQETGGRSKGATGT
jgi:osmotically-inducible protein OsmY